jgi:hypothetical protein
LSTIRNLIVDYYMIIINRMIAEELTEYLIASQIDVQVRQVLDRTVINNMVHRLAGMTTVAVSCI